MRKILSLLMMMFASIALVFADEPVQIASGTFNGKNATYTEGWTTTGTGVSRTDCIIIGADESITSPEVDLSQYESISVAIKARRFGTLSGSKAEIAVTFDGEAIGNTVASGTSATTALDVINYTVSDLSTGNFVVTCTNATSAGSTHGAGINSIVITGVLKSQQGGGEDPQPTTRTIYLNGGGSSLWNQAGAVFFIHAWGGTGADVKMTLVEGDVYSAAIPSDNTSLLFVRMPSGSEAIDWDTKWNQSADQTIPADKNLFTMTDWSNGTWSVYGETPEPPTPVEAAYYLVGTMNNWKADEAYKFAAAEAEGEYLLHTTLAENDEIKVIKVENETTTWYPAEGGNYVVDAAHAGEKDVYFRPAGNEAWAEFGGYIWMGENQPAPVADFTQPFTLKFNGTGQASTDASAAFAADVAAIFDAASAPYVASVETATKVYAGRPIADDNSSVKFGTTSAQGTLAFTLAQAIEVDSIIVNATQYGNDAAEVTINGIKFDLTQGNKVPTDCKLVPNGAISEITIAQTGSQRIYLRNVRVYPKAGETPAEPKFYITGDSALVVDAGLAKDQAWNAAAIKSMEVSYKLNLKANVDYKLKVTLDGTWTDGMSKGFSALTTTADGLAADGDDNICFKLNTAGEVNVHYDGEFFFLNGDFYVAPAPEKKYYLKNNWDGAADWTWKEMTKLDDGTYMLAEVVFGGTGLDLNTSESEEGKTWIAAEDITTFDAAYEPATLGALDTVVFFFDPEAVNQYTGENGMTAQIIGKYIPVPEPKFYITGDSALVVDAGLAKDQAWNAAAIKSMEVSYKLNLKANVDYKLKVTLDGTWTDGMSKGFSALTTTADGLAADGDDNICFKLNTAGEVNVHYDGEFFFLNGDFYVAPVEVKYYLKNNWDGAADWTWKELVYDEDNEDYELVGVVFGGTGVNLNTAESDEGATWIAAEDITAFDASVEPATLGALDTVVFFFDPEEVNQYTGANGLTAQIIGKYIPVPVEHTYTVAGGSTDLFGTAWAPANEANDMVLVEGIYTWEKTELTLAAGTIEFKVCEDHAWTTAYPAQNYKLNIPEAGIYTVTITFNAETKEVAAVATKTGSAVVIPTVAMHGNFLGGWADTENFAIAEGNATASLTLNIEAGDYEFGMRIGGSGNWTANGVSFTRENPSAVIVAGSGNLKLAADKAGEYTFTWTYETNTLAITFPNGSGTGVDNAVVDVKAVKVIRDNQILIIKGDKTFNIQGQLVK